MVQPTPPAPLVVEPTGNPTRKWGYARIFGLLSGAVAVVAIFGFDLPETVNIEALAAAVVVITEAGAGIAGWLTHNRANT